MTSRLFVKIINGLVLATAIIAILSAFFPWYSSHLMDKSSAQSKAGYETDSLQSAQAAVDFNPLSVDALLALADTQQKLGLNEQAKKTLIHATEVQPNNYLVWKDLALFEKQNNMTDQAVRHLMRAIELNPLNKGLQNELGITDQ